MDHVIRIIEGVYRAGSGEDEQWFFGFGKDCLITTDDTRIPPDIEEHKIYARLQMFLSAVGVATKDSMVLPVESDRILQQLREFFSAESAIPDILESVLSVNANSEALQQAFAYEMLQKLDDMAERSRTAVQERHLLDRVPEAGLVKTIGNPLPGLMLC